MKIKVTKSVDITEEIEVEFPIYSYIDGEDEKIYVKIDQDYKFYRITVGHVSIDLHTQKLHKSLPISEHWIKNKCDKDDWDAQLEHTKKYLDKF
jgi:hypothetical protein